MKVAIGLAWYTRETYAACLRIFEDSSDLHLTYDEWLPVAESVEKAEKATGGIVVRAFIDPATFKNWCVANGQRPDKDGRIAFANIRARDEVMKHGESRGK